MSQTAADRALVALRALVVDGGLAPGARLTVAALCSRLGYGAMPLRQALLRLAGEGLIELDPHRGARVVRLDAERIRGLYGLRAAVLALLMPGVVHHVSDADIEALQAIERECEHAAAAHDVARFLPANRRFHRSLHAIARAPDAEAVLERTWPLVDALRRRHGFGPARLAAAMASHRALLGALRARDAVAATAEAVRSSDSAMEDLLALEAGLQRGDAPSQPHGAAQC